MKRFLRLMVVFCWFFLMTEQAVFAYLDPGTDLPPRTSPPSKLDLGPLEVHSTG